MLLFLTVSNVFSQSQDKNYVKTTELLEPVSITTLNNSGASIDKIESVTYMDGLGRAMQSIAVKQSPLGKDVVQYVEYDQYGRSTKKYLPLPTAQTSGNFVSTNVQAQIMNYYQSNFSDQHPFSETSFDDSPLNRVQEVSSPGDTWQLDASSDTDHTNKVFYDVNALNEVYNIQYIPENTNQPFTFQYYNKGELYKNIAKNENWKPTDGKLNTKEVFTDKNGKKIAEFKYEQSGEVVKKLATYNVYDSAGRLIFIFPPKAMENLWSTEVYTPFSNNYLWSGLFQTPSTVNGTGNYAISAQPYIGSTGEMYKQVKFDFNINAPYSFSSGGGGILKTGNIVQLPTSANLPNTHLFSVYPFVLKKGGAIPIEVPPVVPFGFYEQPNPQYSRYEYSIQNGYLYCEFKVGTNLGSPTTPFMVYAIDKTYQRNFSVSSFNNSVLDDLCYQYKYDVLNRQIKQKAPGKGWESIVFDLLNRPILTQDAQLKEVNKWEFVKYDVLGRVVYTGIYNSSLSRDLLQEQVFNFINLNNNNLSNIEKKTPTLIITGGLAMKYSNNAFPINNISEVLSVNYYDNYDIPDLSLSSVPTTILGQEVTTELKGLITSSWIKTMGEEEAWSKMYNFYDKKGNVISTQEINHLGGLTKIDSKLNFRGKVENSVTTHKRLNADVAVVIADRFEYDHVERPKKQFQQINNQEEELIAANEYNELGQLVQKKLGGNAGQSANDRFTSISGLSAVGGVIEKSNPTPSWSHGFATESEINGNGYVEYQVTQNNKRVMVGLSTDSPNHHYNTIDYAIYHYNSNQVLVFESGVNKGTYGTYVIGDVFSIHRDGTTITYKKNGTVFYTSTVPSTGNLIGDAAFYDPGTKIRNFFISSDYKDIVDLSLNTQNSNTVQIKKETGAGWGAGLATTDVVYADGSVSYIVDQNNKYLMVGLSSTNTNASYAAINYAIYNHANGNVLIYESGVNKGTHATYAAGDKFSVERNGTVVSYKKNGVVFYTSLIASTGDLVGDISIHTIGASITNLAIENNQTGLQTIDFEYNIRGWLTKLNDVDNLGNDLFAYKMNYQVGEGVYAVTPQYNGNISQTIWKSATDNTKKSYAYSYDKLSRFVNAKYTDGATLANNLNRFSSSVSGYDSNGNITGVVRYGVDNSNNFVTIDNLAYSYTDGNQLTSIADATNNTLGFNNANTGNDDYAYDVNGNLIKDLNKGITNIEYNRLDLVTKVVFANGSQITFIYDASGKKLQMKSTQNGITTTTDYLGGFQYRNNQLLFFPTAEGYAQKNGSTFSYTYVITDHLGNNRLSFSDANNDGTVAVNEILSHTNYYAMGLSHAGATVVGGASNYNYYFQGKEQLSVNGYNIYDFGSRMYDASVGRWFNTDPKNQFASPYVAMGNNYIMMIDPDGEFSWLVGALIGGAVNTLANWATGDVKNWEDAALSFIGGGISSGAGGHKSYAQVLTSTAFNKFNAIATGDNGVTFGFVRSITLDLAKNPGNIIYTQGLIEQYAAEKLEGTAAGDVLNFGFGFRNGAGKGLLDTGQFLGGLFTGESWVAMYEGGKFMYKSQPGTMFYYMATDEEYRGQVAGMVTSVEQGVDKFANGTAYDRGFITGYATEKVGETLLTRRLAFKLKGLKTSVPFDPNLAINGFKIPRQIGYKKLSKMLRENGFEFIRNGKGDHKIWGYPGSKNRMTIPDHKQISIGVRKNIQRWIDELMGE